MITMTKDRELVSLSFFSAKPAKTINKLSCFAPHTCLNTGLIFTA